MNDLLTTRTKLVQRLIDLTTLTDRDQRDRNIKELDYMLSTLERSQPSNGIQLFTKKVNAPVELWK